MIRPLELQIGLRYTRAKRRNQFISFISLISVLGIVIGVWALITVLSIMNGFERELRERILAVASHVTITGPRGELTDWPRLSERVEQAGEVVGQAPFILGQGMLIKGPTVSGALIRGIAPSREANVSTVLDSLTAGDVAALVPRDWNIIIGSALASKLDVVLGDKVTVVAPKGQVTPAGFLPRLKRFRVAGIFELGMYEYDSALALIHIEDAARLFRTEGRATGLRLKLKNVYDAPRVRQKLIELLGSGVGITDWTREHSNLFRALKIEKRVMFIILLLIVAVAAFNIVSTLIMVVSDKEADVAILRTLGISPLSVMGIFVVQGVMIGITGTLIGTGVGVLTAINIETLVPWLEELLNTEFFPSSIYVITDFPAQMKWPDVILIASASFGISLVATLYPAWRASRTQPAEALRYE
ncbi:MAG: lipoprotein-releasing system transmembrane subunit LolC [Acidiferrobacteraceae bacterium]|jgi:lipoprotein-releasing system permease protein|nr:lipoprotein-releasing system transmembrane subunit LolC [Acidiferrobacteraceae bacterium]